MTLDDFLGYCKLHSQTSVAGFHVNHANALYSMAGYPLIQSSDIAQNYLVISIYEPEMNEILEIIERRRNSIDVKFERVD